MDFARVSVNDLAKACAHSANAAEWAEFLRRSTPLVSLVATRVTRIWMNTSSPAIVDDITQEVFLKLCEQERRILREFESRGEDSFFGLLRIVTGSVANDYFRRMHSVKRGGKVVTSQLNEEGGVHYPARDASSGPLHQNLLLEQLDRMMQSAPDEVGERDRTLFWLYYRQGFTAEEIASVSGLGLSAKGVESALRRVTKWVRGEVEKRKPTEESG
jgi:RNA polymerase sigma-70 factor (ECF subfamily)